ncbi:MAG TPA: DUF5611 family protein [Candidatus Methanomethylophilaceae archaeon]|nr:DUF5611 family protein [Candidatus Methanomethylophilaceae archaeon]
MVLYDIKRGWFNKLEGDGLKNLMKDIFGNVEVDGDIHTSKYGVLAKIEVEILSKSEMRVETFNVDPKEMTDDSILDSKRKLNVFAEAATGFDVKARKKRAQDKIKKGTL